MPSDELTYDDYLEHYGVKGMKWGKRKRNANYSDDQMKRDSQVYGKRGAKRINKNMNKGDSVSTARSLEKTRRDTVASNAVDIRGRTDRSRGIKRTVGGTVGTIVGGVGASRATTALGNLATSRVGQQALTKITKDPVISAQLGASISTFTRNPKNRLAISSGGAVVGGMMGTNAPRTVSKAYVKAKGYNPNRL